MSRQPDRRLRRRSGKRSGAEAVRRVGGASGPAGAALKPYRKFSHARPGQARQRPGQGRSGRDLNRLPRGSVFGSVRTCCLLVAVALLGERRPANRDDH
jgi:hypothetical protein